MFTNRGAWGHGPKHSPGRPTLGPSRHVGTTPVVVICHWDGRDREIDPHGVHVEEANKAKHGNHVPLAPSW